MQVFGLLTRMTCTGHHIARKNFHIFIGPGGEFPIVKKIQGSGNKGLIILGTR